MPTIKEDELNKQIRPRAKQLQMVDSSNTTRHNDKPLSLVHLFISIRDGKNKHKNRVSAYATGSIVLSRKSNLTRTNTPSDQRLVVITRVGIHPDI